MVQDVCLAFFLGLFWGSGKLISVFELVNY
jgi:hypothetical protein